MSPLPLPNGLKRLGSGAVEDSMRRLAAVEVPSLARMANHGSTQPSDQELLEGSGLKVVGFDQDDEARILELATHTFYVATLFLPQSSSTEQSPHPLILAYVDASCAFRANRPA